MMERTKGRTCGLVKSTGTSFFAGFVETLAHRLDELLQL